MTGQESQYTCPQCNGDLNSSNGDFVCRNCGLNVTDVLKHVIQRDGPLADVASQVKATMGKS